MTDATRYAVYSIRRGKDSTNPWTKVGFAYKNKDGSINIYLEALPIDGQLHVREAGPPLPGDGGHKPGDQE